MPSRDAILTAVVAILIALSGWVWSLGSRLAVTETRQSFLMDEREDVKQLIEINHKMDKRLSIIENYLVGKTLPNKNKE